MATLALADFFELWDLVAFNMALPPSVQQSRTADGQILRHGSGERLWTGRVALKSAGREGQRIEAIIDRLQEPGEDFLMRDPYIRHPASDPEGALIDGATLITTVAQPADRRRLRLSGFPVGYDLRPGDRVAVGAGGRYAYFRINEGAVADGGGLLELGVAPWRPLWIDGNENVIIRWPRLKAVIVPGSYGGGDLATSGRFAGPSFSFMQTLA